MTLYQFRTRIHHLLKAKHWRGHGIHSPMLYSLIREEIMRYPKKLLAQRLAFRFGEDRVTVVENARDIAIGMNYCVILKEPFIDKDQEKIIEQLYQNNHCTMLHCQGFLVIFFDPKLNKQYIMLRN